jgi:hypothetical protein
MKKLLSLFILICFVTLSNAMVFRTMDGKTITGKMKTNESKRLEIDTTDGIVFLDKDKISKILDDNGFDVTSDFIKAIPKADIIHKAMQDAVVKKDISEMTDREFALYMNDQQTKSLNKISSTMWYIYGCNFIITFVCGFILYNNLVTHPRKHLL